MPWPVPRKPKALLLCEDFRVSGLCFRSRSDNIDGGVERNRYRRQAQLGAACLIAQLQRDVLFTERSSREGVNGQSQNHGSLINIERLFGKSERFEISLGINDFAAAEARGEVRFEVCGDEILFRLFA